MFLTESVNQLSAQQRRELEQISESWRKLGLSTAVADRTTAESGLALAYQSAGLKSPTIRIWLNSPRAGATAARLLKSDLDWPFQLDQGQRAVWDSVWQQSVSQIQLILGNERWQEVRRTIRREADKKILDKYGQPIEKRVKELFAEKMGIWVWKYLREMAGTSTFQQVRIDVEQRVKASVSDQVSHTVLNEIYQELVPPLRQQVWGAVAEPLRQMMTINNGVLVGQQTWECGFGNHDVGWLAYYVFLRQIGIKGIKPLLGLEKLTKSCGWWWPYENICLLTERPVELNRDNRGRLHSETKMAVKYADGWGFYAWHGVIVPDYVILLPQPITIEMIESEPNTEVRRVLIERFGLDNYLKAGRVVKIHQDKCGILYRMSLNRDEPIMVVHVVNSTPEPDGSFNEYFLRVPPNMTRAKQAVAWTFGLTEEEYFPVVES